IFEGDGIINDFAGNYTQYRNKLDIEKEAESVISTNNQNSVKKAASTQKEKTKQKKLSFNEKREFEQLENEITELELAKTKLELELNSGDLHHDKLYQKSEELTKIKTLLDEKE